MKYESNLKHFHQKGMKSTAEWKFLIKNRSLVLTSTQIVTKLASCIANVISWCFVQSNFQV